MSPSRANRRRALGVMAGSALAAWGVKISRAAAAEADTATALIAELIGSSPLREGREGREGGIRLTIPALADTGQSVPVTIDVDSPMTANDFVKNIYLIAPRNPRPLVASVFLSPLSGRASFTTRMRLAGEQQVVAIAIRSDGTHCIARAQVVVAVSACLDGT